MSASLVDPRPLLGEPLALDLLDTRWRTNDLLENLAGVETWLATTASSPGGVPPELLPPVVDERVRHALLGARDAVLAVAEHPDDPAARDAFNAVLARGHRARLLGPDGPGTRVVVPDPAWTLGWLAAENYVDLLEASPGRIRRCEHPDCILWYLDTSRSGTRRWCSMSGCGNRAKAGRHYRRREAAGLP